MIAVSISDSSESLESIQIKSEAQATFLYYHALNHLASELHKQLGTQVCTDQDHFGRAKNIVSIPSKTKPEVEDYLARLDGYLNNWSEELDVDLGQLIKRPQIIEHVEHATFRKNKAFSIDLVTIPRVQAVYELILLSRENDKPLLSDEEIEKLEHYLSPDYEHSERIRSLRRTGYQYIVNALLADGANQRCNLNHMLILVGHFECPHIYSQRPRKQRSDAGQREIIFAFDGGYVKDGDNELYVEPLTLFLSNNTRTDK